MGTVNQQYILEVIAIFSRGYPRLFMAQIFLIAQHLRDECLALAECGYSGHDINPDARLDTQ